ncbi:MAG: hypothetical protein EXR28_03030 [Betaproteobacteria bacterium]|nr:hypothetical protein [Betaproteobacteria bacterium]
MKLSPFFKDLSKTYAYEIEDLTYDSSGVNILKSRLKVKRDRFQDLLPMIAFEPVMVVAAFHGAFQFSDKALLEKLVSGIPGSFPAWKTLAAAIRMEPWADKLAQVALKSEGGEQFMQTAAGLEFILSGLGATAAAGEEERAVKEAGDDNEDDKDPGQDGEDYLSDQGFERRG